MRIKVSFHTKSFVPRFALKQANGTWETVDTPLCSKHVLLTDRSFFSLSIKRDYLTRTAFVSGHVIIYLPTSEKRTPQKNK